MRVRVRVGVKRAVAVAHVAILVGVGVVGVGGPARSTHRGARRRRGGTAVRLTYHPDDLVADDLHSTAPA